MASPHITVKATSSITEEQACDARAQAWTFIFSCHAKKEAARPGGPDNTKESKNDGAATTNLTR